MQIEKKKVTKTDKVVQESKDIVLTYYIPDEEMTSKQTKLEDFQENNNNTETRNNENSQLKHIVQQTIDKIEAGTKEIVMRNSELRRSSEKYLKTNNPNDNFENNRHSQTNLISDTKPLAKCRPHWKQFWAALGPYLMLFSAGLSGGFSATLLPQLKQEQSAILINNDTPSWIASMAALPMAPACLIGGWLMEKLGRRRSIIILSIPFFVGWILIACALNLTQMLMGRFLNGMSVGLMVPCLSVFISETSDPTLRGMFLAFLSLFLAIGVLVAHLIGTWISWQYTATICAFFPLISASLLLCVPESPVWLFSKGRTEHAIKSFHWLRGYDEETESELKALIDKYKSIDPLSLESWKQKLKKFNSKIFLKPLLIVVTIYITCQFSGVPTITFYSIDITETAVGEGINRYLAMIVIDVIRVITTLITCLTCRKCPRRYLCIISGALTTLSMASLSIFLYFHKNTPTHLAAVPLCLLSAYIIAVNIGFLPLPWIIVGEIFPTTFRSIGAGLASSIGYFSTFVVVKTAPGMMLSLGHVATFMFYAVFSLLGTTILFFILPETKDKSLLEIEALFKKSAIFK